MTISIDQLILLLTAPVIVAAIVSGVVSLIVANSSRTSAESIAAEKNSADIALAAKRFEFEKGIAEQKVAFEKEQILFKRKFELAEEVLSDAYQFERVMGYVRSPGSYGTEGETRPVAKDQKESESVKRNRDTYFVPIERIKKESEFFSKMLSKRFTCRAYFGDEMDKAFQDIHMAPQTVAIYANILIRRVSDSSMPEPEAVLRQRDKAESIIWDMPYESEPNEVSQQIQEAIEIIERLTKPILQRSGTT